MIEKLGFLAVEWGGSFYATGHPIWGMGTLVVAGLLLRDSGIPGSLWAKMIGDLGRFISKRLQGLEDL